MKADIVVLIIKLFTHYILLLFVEACIYIYLFDCTCLTVSIFYVKFTDNFLNYVLIMCCLYCDYFHIHMELYFVWIYKN